MSDNHTFKAGCKLEHLHSKLHEASVAFISWDVNI